MKFIFNHVWICCHEKIIESVWCHTQIKHPKWIAYNDAPIFRISSFPIFLMWAFLDYHYMDHVIWSWLCCPSARRTPPTHIDCVFVHFDPIAVTPTQRPGTHVCNAIYTHRECAYDMRLQITRTDWPPQPTNHSQRYVIVCVYQFVGRPHGWMDVDGWNGPHCNLAYFNTVPIIVADVVVGGCRPTPPPPPPLSLGDAARRALIFFSMN